MREILFRGKSLDNGEWEYGGIYIEGNHYYILCPKRYFPDTRDWDIAEYYENNPTYVMTKVEVDPSTVGQYTVLKNKNGKRIFEGDIIDQSGCRWVVEFQNSAFVASNEDDAIQFALFEQYNYDWDNKIWVPPDYFEVIGNIYDNPELLKEGTD